MKETSTIHPIKAIRRAGVPLVAFETSDPAKTIASTTKAVNGKPAEPPFVQWDIVRGYQSLNAAGQAVARDLGGSETAGDPAQAVNKLSGNITKDSLVFLHNAHKYVQDAATIQAMWNLRDVFKQSGCTLVLLCPAITLPPELQNDVVVVTEPLPTPEEVGAIIDSVTKDAEVSPIKADEKPKVIDTLLGVSAFAAEQAFAMSLSKDGVDRDALWHRKRKMIEQTPGLSLWKDRVTFDDVGGLENLKRFITKLLTSGRNPVRMIVYQDEIEKSLAGSAGDLSGVSQDQLRVFLTEMQDGNIPGIILVGAPGVGKSLVSKCAATVCDGETLAMDTGAMTGSLVGESQAKIRHAWQTARAVSQGKMLVIATCNKITSLPPELRRRFKLGTFFLDLPDAKERASIWRLKLKQFGLKDGKLPDDDGWTGAEIEACCDIAYRCDVSLEEASTFIVPVSRSAADQIEALRKAASGRFISASKPGIYNWVESQNTGRRMEIK